AGPIVKYKTVAAELVHRTVTSRDFAEGACRFTAGLAKKVLLANAAGALWESCQASQNAGALTVAGGWTGLFAFGFQIYFDFSGYSDMAVGLGRILGFRFDENFDHPYLSTSVGEFWRRWHMSLTSWFREYLYFPLGGSRAGRARTLRNLLVVWFCTGFWHGASWNFILWGLYFGLWLILERFVFRDLLARTPVLVKRVYTLLVVFVGWGIFAMEDLGVCGRYLAVCFGGGPLWSAPDGYRLRSWALILLLLALGSTTLAADLWKKVPEQGRRVLAPVLMALGLIVSTAYLVDGSYNPFLYFRF
ncbi:MAG: MBOAT family protein, partial [Oscillibacter sp.]|nr:MBOAT family protein [Oscillibacter sp.]